MTENTLQDPPENDESVSNNNNELDSDEISKESKGILSYSSKGKQSVISLFGIELTAPSGLKNPGIVYLAFIVINLFIFLVLRSFISG
tara:strand:+ start:906 stop:1169 length:264 start_codon:yes stop_codon:yes gene_type:complete